MFCTSSDETSGKQFRGWEMEYVGETVWVGGPERAERICAVFDVKKSMNLLHCSSVAAVNWLWFEKVVYSGKELLGISWAVSDDIGVKLWPCFFERLCIFLLLLPVDLFMDSEARGSETPLKDPPCCLHLTKLICKPGCWVGEGDCSCFNRGMEVQEAALMAVVVVHCFVGW